ncbi:MAG: hypothetical protein F6K11_27960 [Leptolyngbya sp. SIO3F4]|nr:hypothetical protein [Leptolyngbya sp. SIO3F4]
MGRHTKQFWLTILILSGLSACTQNQAATQTTLSPATETVTESTTEFCPIPPVDYEKIPGYQPGRVNPSLSEKTLQIISPTLDEGDDRHFYEGLLQQPIQFCGTAKDAVVKVKLFSTGAYIYEQQLPDPAEPTLLLGGTTVDNGLWFISHEFREDAVGKRTIVARGYDANDQLVDETEIILTIADINPG